MHLKSTLGNVIISLLLEYCLGMRYFFKINNGLSEDVFVNPTTTALSEGKTVKHSLFTELKKNKINVYYKKIT